MFGTPPQTCVLPLVTLGPGEWVQIDVSVLVMAPYDRCDLTNTARIAVPPGGSPQNTDVGDDVSSATVLIDSPRCIGERTERTNSNLQIRKTVISWPCRTANLRVAGLAWGCDYAIQVRNTGPGVYYGSIQIEDFLPELPAGSRVHIRAPGGPAYEGPALSSHRYTLPGVSLGPGGWQAILVTVTVPQSYDACELTNTAKITWAPGGSPQNSDRGDDESSATAPIDSPRCIGSRSEPIVPGPPEPTPCPQGWSRTPVPGKCCPPRTTWDGKRCLRGAPPLEEKCPPNSDSAYKYPDCRCEQGYVGTPPNCKRIGVPPKECPEGYVGTPPNCKRLGVPPKECPKGTKGKYPDCEPIECPKGTTGKYPDCKPIVPECKKGEKLVNGKCVGVTGRVVCGPDSVLNRRTGQCEPLAPTAPQVCPKGFTGTPPNCKRIIIPPKDCPKGFVGTPPNCKPAIVPPKKCPKGFVGTPPNCKRIIVPPKECPKGFVGTPPNCKLVIVPPKTCPKGTTGTYPNCKPVGAQVIKKL